MQIRQQVPPKVFLRYFKNTLKEELVGRIQSMPADDPRLLILVLALETDGRLKRVSRLLNPILYFVTGAVAIAVSSVLGI